MPSLAFTAPQICEASWTKAPSSEWAFASPRSNCCLVACPDQPPLLAKLARPVAHLDAKDPPLPLLHGDADPQMPLAQSEEFHREYQTSKLTSKLVIIPDAKHGGPDFYDKDRRKLVSDFLSKHLSP